MWHSGNLDSNEALLTVKVPLPIPVDRILVYSQHSGNYHMVEAVSMRFYLGGQPTYDYSERVHYPDKELLFPVQQTDQIELKLKAGTSKMIVIRGMRFFNGVDEIPLGSAKFLH